MGNVKCRTLYIDAAYTSIYYLGTMTNYVHVFKF